ncbi:hypothetical protein JCGZ_23931 [Jatropha curcas]|uniref:Cytochrome P450 n=1 Tax=Jatropha curcas TaxID=180498 RepID=A0A067JP93_JATCU|nr:hypothetical protein JCGZ_23931 [Jatropha curcas]
MEHQVLSFPVLLSFLIFLVLLKLSKKLYKHDSNPPPGPWRLPILGNILQLAGDLPHHRLAELAKTYGPVMGIKLGQIPFLVVSSREAAKEVMKSLDPIFAERATILVNEIVNYNRNGMVFGSYGDHWRQMRKFCTLELLSVKRVRSFQSVREEEMADFVKFLRSKEGSSVNLTHTIFSFTNSIIARNAVGHKSKNQETLLRCIDGIIITGGVNIADVFPSLKWLPSVKREKSRIMKLHRETDEILEDILQEHKAKRHTAVSKNGNQRKADNFLDVLLDLQESEDLDLPLTDVNIKAAIMDVFIGGSDTSSKTTEWAMAELMRKPEIMKKAQEELRSVFGEKGYIEEAKLQELKWLKLIIKETMRLHPVLSVLPRVCREKTKVSGYDVYPDTRVLVNVWALGRDPTVWSEPEKFNPERFIDSSIDYLGNHFEYLPFGAGKRVCPGIALGMVHMENFLANLLFHFDWKFPKGITAENLDMTDAFGGVMKRKVDLELIPIPYHP